MNQLHTIFTPRDPPEPSIYDQLREFIDQAESFDANRHPVEALISLTNAKLLLVSHLTKGAN